MKNGKVGVQQSDGVRLTDPGEDLLPDEQVLDHVSPPHFHHGVGFIGDNSAKIKGPETEQSVLL